MIGFRIVILGLRMVSNLEILIRCFGLQGFAISSEKLEKLGIEPGSPANMASALTTELPNRAR